MTERQRERIARANDIRRYQRTRPAGSSRYGAMGAGGSAGGSGSAGH